MVQLDSNAVVLDAREPDAPVLDALAVSKSFGAVVALRNASLLVRKGQVVALRGANGAGKSTFIKILTGALRPDGGHVRIRGRETAVGSPAEARRSGLVPVYQEPSLIPDLDVADNLRLGNTPVAAFRHWVDALGIPDLPLDAMIGRLPLATLRILDLARALAAKPDVLRHSRGMLAHYAMARTSYEQLAKRGILPSYILFSEMDFQVSWMLSVQEAAEALLVYERLNNRRFERIVTLDFVDPLPIMLGRTPLLDMSIGNDPTRTLMKLNVRADAEIRRADAILLPKCPPTDARNAIASAYDFALEGRRVVALTPCFTMMVRD